MNSVSPICCFRSNRILSVQPKHTTWCHLFHNRKNSLPLILCFFWSSSTQWILSSTSITFLSLLYVVTQGSNPFMSNSRGRKRLHLYQALLGNWCQRGRERSHQSLSPTREKVLRGRKIFLGGENTQGSQMLDVQEKRCHMSFCRKDMFICAYLH